MVCLRESVSAGKDSLTGLSTLSSSKGTSIVINIISAILNGCSSASGSDYNRWRLYGSMVASGLSSVISQTCFVWLTHLVKG